MTTVVDFRESDDPRDALHKAVQTLAEGGLVALPTETVYVVVASAQHSEAVSRLTALYPGDAVLGVGSADAALDYVPEMSATGRKLARRCWPGPVILGFESPGSTGLLASLPDETQTAVRHAGRVHVRAPAAPIFPELLQLVPAPLVLSAEQTSATGATRDNVLDALGDGCDLVLLQGPCRYGQPSTTVAVRGDDWSITNSGVVTERAVRRLASEAYVFVCTGNTCRSPMAEGLFRKLLAEKLHCCEDELPDHGHVVTSAGIAAAIGAPASPESVEILKRKGIDISGHDSQPLTEHLLDQADHVFTMTKGHRGSILMSRPDMADRVQLLARDGSEIPDPIGCGMSEYQRCESEIERHIRVILDDLEIQ